MQPRMTGTQRGSGQKTRKLVIAGGLLLAAAAPAATPTYGARGIDLTARDVATSPGDGFFRYASGAWLDRTAIAPDEPSASLRRDISDRINLQLREILEREDYASRNHTQPSDDRAKVGAFYRAFMDEARVERLGGRPVQSQLDAIRRAPDLGALAALMGAGQGDVYGSAFRMAVFPDARRPGHYALLLGQGGLGLPDRDFYLLPALAPKRDAYTAYAATLLTLAGESEPGAAAARVTALETRIAQASWSLSARRDPVRTYNSRTLAALQADAPQVDWRSLFGGAGLAGSDRIVVSEPEAVTAIASVLGDTPLPVLKAWLTVRTLDNAAPYLSRPYADAWFVLHGRAVYGQEAPAPRWRRAVRAVAGGDYYSGERLDRFGNLGWTVGALYLREQFPAAVRTRALALVGELKSAFRARIEAADWMGPDTRAEALRKLAAFRVKVGGPERAPDISAVVIRDDDLLGNVRRAATADWGRQRARLARGVEPDAWELTPQTNDAYNGGPLNEVVFPAGILQPPIFDPAADPAVNYGAMGAVIGHELTHGFDDQGRRFDAQGRLRDWWTPQDAARFQAKAKALAAQYDALEPLPGAHVDGTLTLGENIADLGGLAMALDAYHASLHGRPAPVRDELTGDARLFLGWAQAWRGKVREAALRAALVSDPHAPREARVDGVVRNLSPWYGAFGVTPGRRLYLAPDARLRIW